MSPHEKIQLGSIEPCVTTPRPIQYVTKMDIRLPAARRGNKHQLKGTGMARRQAHPRGLRNIPESISSGDRERYFAVSTWLDTTTIPSARAVQYDPRQPYTILLASLAGLFGVEVISIIRWAAPSHPLQLVGSLVSATVVFALQLRNCSPDAERWSAWQRGAVVVSQGVATYLPLLAFGIMWTGMTSFLAGSVLLLAPRWRAWVPFAAIALGTFAAAVATRPGAWDIAFIAIGGPAFGLLVFGLSRLAHLVGHAHAMHAEISQLAAIKERARFAMDLHDLLGYSLSAIALKAELSRRVMETKPDMAREELADVVDFARQAVADVRLVANGYRTMSLAAEAVSAASVLAAAGVMADIELDCGALDDKVDTVLATVLREAVTNLLRHSAARTCRVAASQAGEFVTLFVSNDGVPKSAVACRDGGGLENLAARLETVGGTLTIELQDGTFGLIAAVPHTARAVPGTPRTREARAPG
jgi:two-component system, NarL family, sensor histidine kinase DesK